MEPASSAASDCLCGDHMAASASCSLGGAEPCASPDGFVAPEACASSSFSVTVSLLSGESLRVAGLCASDPLQLLLQRVAAGLGAADAEQLRLFEGPRPLMAEQFGEPLGALGLGEGARLACVRSWPARVFESADAAGGRETMRLRLGSDFRCMLASSSVPPLVYNTFRREPSRYSASCGTYHMEGSTAVCSWEQHWTGISQARAKCRVTWRRHASVLLPATFNLDGRRWVAVDDPALKSDDGLGVCLPDWQGFDGADLSET